MLRGDRVSKSYGNNKALDDVSIEVHRGEFVALLGPNGAGKSTLFQLLTGLFVADGGAIYVNGKDIRTSAVDALAALGVVFQQPTLDLDLTVIANLQFHARLHGMARRGLAERMVAELERLALNAEPSAMCRTLSGGNRRKVELVRALLHNPSILLMDEPTVGLDPASRKNIVDYVHSECQERGLGVLWATHLVDEAEGADRVVVLHRGRLLTSGSPAELVASTGKANLADAFLSLTANPGSDKAA
ncbi:MAG: ABC transporter ATP-binding protein [Pseudomonadota bacterium]